MFAEVALRVFFLVLSTETGYSCAFEQPHSDFIDRKRQATARRNVNAIRRKEVVKGDGEGGGRGCGSIERVTSNGKRAVTLSQLMIVTTVSW